MTLTETVFWSKIASRFAIVGVVLIIVGYYAYLYVLTITKTPDQVFRPNNRCGALPQITIEAQQGASYGSAKFQVEALSSSLPNDKVPLITYVYKLDIKGETFETRDLAYSLAKDLDFTSAVQHASGSTIYVWRNNLLRSTLTVNTDTLNFTYERDAAVLPKIPNLLLPATTFRAPEFAGNYLRSLGLYSGEFADGKSFAYPVIMSNGKSYLAKSLDVAQLVRVDFQKVNPLLYYDKAITAPTYNTSTLIDFVGFLKIAQEKKADEKTFMKYTARRVGKTPETANVQVYMRNQDGTPSEGLQELVFNNWKVEDIPCGTYLILRPSDAISKISQGEGTIVYLVEKGGDPLQPSVVPSALSQINLYNLELVYYEANQKQPYLQPIYVATGEVVFENGAKGDIAIYMPAIDYGAQAK